MPKIPLGSSPRPSPDDPSLSPLQKTTSPLPAVEIAPEELLKLGLTDAPLASAPLHSGDKIASFVQRVAPAAQEAAAKLNVPTEAVIAQWALESGWGQSALAAKYNNFGGIKALGTSWKGDTVAMPSYERNRTVLETSPFRVYHDVSEYGADYTNFLARNPRYKNVLGTNSVSSFADALGKAGYHDDDDASYRTQMESIASRVRKYLAPSQ